MGVVDDKWQDESDREADKKCCVLAVAVKDFLGTNGSPHHGCGEELVDSRTSVMIFLGGCADAFYLVHLKVQDTSADDGGDDSGDHLGPESLAGWDLDVMGEFEVISEPKGVAAGYISTEFM